MVLVLRDPEQILKANGCTPCQAINPLEINDIRQTKPRQFDNVVLSSQHTHVVLSGQHWSECLYYQHGFYINITNFREEIPEAQNLLLFSPGLKDKGRLSLSRLLTRRPFRELMSQSQTESCPAHGVTQG